MVGTRQRLIHAAAVSFARSGLQGATTRQIAQEAGLNEVTLFRHFKTKEKLIAAVVQETFIGQEDAAGVTNNIPDPPAAPEDLRSALLRHARRYEGLLQGNILLVRTMLGEIHRHREHEAHVLKGIFAPLKASLIVTIESARDRGAIRPEIDPVIAADLLGGMILSEVLRRCSTRIRPLYPAATYVETAVEVFARGIETAPPPAV